MRSLLLSCSLAVSAGVPAQSFYIPSNTPTTGTCNVIPFGTTSSSATWVNQRYQTIITAADLNNMAGFINGLAFASCGTGMRQHASIDVTMSLVPSGYTLTSTFAANLPAPTVVLSATNYSWENIAHAWTFIGLQKRFLVDGVSDIVVDILVTGNHHLGSGTGFHRDVRPRLFATSWTGSAPLSGSSDLAALKMCVGMGDAMISIHGAGCAGLTLSVVGSARLGSAQLDVNASGGGATQPIALNTGIINSTPFPLDLTPFGFTNCFFYNDILAAVPSATSASGTATIQLAPLPTTPALVGAKLYAQFAHVNPAAPGGGATSNYARIVLGN
jgi:hypothetical protein